MVHIKYVNCILLILCTILVSFTVLRYTYILVDYNIIFTINNLFGYGRQLRHNDVHALHLGPRSCITDTVCFDLIPARISSTCVSAS